MEFFGGLLVLFGAIVFPLVLIVGLIKPSLIKKPDKTPASRKQIAVFSIVAGLLCLGIGGSMLPAVEDELAATANEPDSLAKPAETDPQPVADAPVVAEVKETPKIAEPVAKAQPITAEKTLPDFNITSDEFVKNYNAVISKADKNMIINSIEDGQTVTYAPMPSNATMGGVIADSGDLRGLIITISGSGNNSDNLGVMGVMLAAANGVQGSIAKEEISQGVLDIFTNAVENPNKPQNLTIGNAKYVANFMPNMGGVIFTIDAV